MRSKLLALASDAFRDRGDPARITAGETGLRGARCRDVRSISRAPNRYQAVPPQHAIGMGNVLGNPKRRTTLRL
jgi:hypothetical protein